MHLLGCHAKKLLSGICHLSVPMVFLISKALALFGAVNGMNVIPISAL